MRTPLATPARFVRVVCNGCVQYVDIALYECMTDSDTDFVTHRVVEVRPGVSLGLRSPFRNANAVHSYPRRNAYPGRHETRASRTPTLGRPSEKVQNG